MNGITGGIDLDLGRGLGAVTKCMNCGMSGVSVEDFKKLKQEFALWKLSNDEYAVGERYEHTIKEMTDELTTLRTELENAESDIDTIAQHNIELQLTLAAYQAREMKYKKALFNIDDDKLSKRLSDLTLCDKAIPVPGDNSELRAVCLKVLHKFSEEYDSGDPNSLGAIVDEVIGK